MDYRFKDGGLDLASKVVLIEKGNKVISFHFFATKKQVEEYSKYQAAFLKVLNKVVVKTSW
ncbi:MAG: hypothetical protein ACN6I4_01815 [bacterium]